MGSFNLSSVEHFSVNQCELLLFVIADSDGDGEPGEGQNSDEEKAVEQDAEEPLSTTVQEGRNEVEEFIDEEHESQFCLETNFMDEEKEEEDRTPEQKDSSGKSTPTWSETHDNMETFAKRAKIFYSSTTITRHTSSFNAFSLFS